MFRKFITNQSKIFNMTLFYFKCTFTKIFLNSLLSIVKFEPPMKNLDSYYCKKPLGLFLYKMNVVVFLLFFLIIVIISTSIIYTWLVLCSIIYCFYLRIIYLLIWIWNAVTSPSIDYPLFLLVFSFQTNYYHWIILLEALYFNYYTPNMLCDAIFYSLFFFIIFFIFTRDDPHQFVVDCIFIASYVLFIVSLISFLTNIKEAASLYFVFIFIVTACLLYNFYSNFYIFSYTSMLTNFFCLLLYFLLFFVSYFLIYLTFSFFNWFFFVLIFKTIFILLVCLNLINANYSNQ